MVSYKKTVLKVQKIFFKYSFLKKPLFFLRDLENLLLHLYILFKDI